MATRPARPSIKQVPPIGKPSNEEILRLVADFNVLCQKVTDMSNESNAARASYVTNLRTTVSSEEALPESKIVALERVLAKVAELDRLVLLKTAPESAPPARRNSKSAELTSLPTHLLLVNRLLDLHADAKRVTVVRTHTVVGGAGTGSADDRPQSPRSTKDVQLIETLNATISRLNKQIEESGGKVAAAQQDLIGVKTANSELQDRLDQAESKLKGDASKLAKLDELTASLSKSNAKIEVLKKELSEALAAAKSTPAPIAVPPPQAATSSSSSSSASTKAPGFALNDYEKLIAALGSVRSAVDSQTIDSFASSHTDSLDPTSKAAVTEIVQSINRFIRNTQHEINILLSARDQLESDLATNTVQRDILSGDLASATSELEVMKGAFSGMESETIDLRRKLDIERAKNQELSVGGGNQSGGGGGGVSKEELVAAQRRLAAANDLLHQLQEDLAVSTRRNIELERLPKDVASLEARIVMLESDKGQLKAANVGLTNEVESYKKLTESLKEKLKAASNSDKDFFDTFEEVMRDEMATMKSAFEAKLRAARDESDQLSRKHSQEILRLQQESRSPPSKFATASSSSSSASSSRYGSSSSSSGLKMAASNVIGFRDT